jgi:hypothetical protein
MLYSNNLFNYYGKEKRQYRLDLDKANNNFTILANAFKDNNPDTGILKNTDTLNRYHASQIPQPNTIPASYDTGKLDVGWFPWEDIAEKLAQKYYNNIINVSTVDDVATVDNFSIKSGVYVISFTKAKRLAINLQMEENMILNVKLFAAPHTTIGEYAPPPIIVYPGVDEHIALFPNHSLTPFPINKMYDNKTYNYIPICGLLTYSTESDPPTATKLPLIYYNIDIRKTKNINFVKSYGIQLLYYNVDTFQSTVRKTDIASYVTRDDGLLFLEWFDPRYYNSWTYSWYPYTSDGTYVPWTTFGTIRSPYRMDGTIIIKRLA